MHCYGMLLQEPLHWRAAVQHAARITGHKAAQHNTTEDELRQTLQKSGGGGRFSKSIAARRRNAYNMVEKKTIGCNYKKVQHDSYRPNLCESDGNHADFEYSSTYILRCSAKENL